MFTDKELETVQSALLYAHQTIDIVSCDEEDITSLESAMTKIGLKEGDDFYSLLPRYKELFP